ncbi:MAG: NADP-dependent malic enzyme [Melioribacteraceae bacterium]|nr:NADP-dependent malic enzyme [Melioribacteraceae bacterium]
MTTLKEDALRYHSEGRKGKIEVIASKPCFTSRELSLAYTPGVAAPCLEISECDEKVYEYTAKGNLVAVVSNGTAVLGLGDIGPHAGKPVMEGKGVLFKRFADIDVFDIELDTKDPKEIIRAVQLLEPTFGGINLEDIKAPECFEVEEELKKTMNIPVFHDDQHGTAIISCAALLNALEIANKNISDVKIVVSGAGASAVACSNLYILAGAKRENIFMFDSKGLLSTSRSDLNKYKMAFAQDAHFDSLGDGMKGADVLVGLSRADLVSADMIKGMAENPIVFAMANPDPEIRYEIAVEARKDIIMATGRSDYPNQVNNVLGFPFIFRGALDVKAKAINDEMKMAAVKALSELAKEKVPETVISAYGGKKFNFGREYIIPKPFDPRVLWKVAPAVAKAAMDTGVARKPITNWKSYEDELKERLGFSKELIRNIIHRAAENPVTVVYPEGEEENIIRAASIVQQEHIANPVLIGNEEKIKTLSKQLKIDSSNFKIVDPFNNSKYDDFPERFFELRKRKGARLADAKKLMLNNNYFASMMVQSGNADALISGLTTNYPDTIRPALQCVGKKENVNVVSGLYIVIIKSRVFFLADTTVNINPNAEELAEIAICTANTVSRFELEPKIAMLSFSNFGSADYPESKKVREAVKIIKRLRPELIVDGEMQADTAVVPEIIENEYPFSDLKGGANVLIFPDLSSGNIAYKLLQRLTDATVIGPILMGLKKPVHVLQMGATVDDIINMTAIAVVEANYQK